MITFEVVSIGNEILKGMILNTNVKEISQALVEAGYKPWRHTSLPDEHHLLKPGLQECLNRSRIVITTGGLGPTCDDTTRQAAADLFQSDFYLNQDVAESLKKRYGNALISLENQATVPTKATILHNEFGTAPGLAFHTPDNTLILMPGIPREMRPMLHSKVIPFLKHHFPQKHCETKKLLFFNLSESAIDPAMRQIQHKYPDIELGIYPSHGVLTVQLTSFASDDEGLKNLDEAAKTLSTQFSKNYFESPSGKIEEAIQKLFIEKKWTLSIAESCTGGAIASALTKQPGSSQYFLGGIVCYSNESKMKLLNVSEECLNGPGAVSEQAVIEMAQGALELMQSDFSIAVSGIAGPTGGTAEKPVGTIWMAIGQRGHAPKAWLLQSNGNREINIERSVYHALGGLLSYCRSVTVA